MALRPGITEPDFKPLGRLKIPAPIKFFVRFIQAAVTGGGPGPWRQLQHRPTNPVWKEMAWKSTCMHCMHHSYSMKIWSHQYSLEILRPFSWCHYASSCYILLHPQFIADPPDHFFRAPSLQPVRSHWTKMVGSKLISWERSNAWKILENHQGFFDPTMLDNGIKCLDTVGKSWILAPFEKHRKTSILDASWCSLNGSIIRHSSVPPWRASPRWWHPPLLPWRWSRWIQHLEAAGRFSSTVMLWCPKDPEYFSNNHSPTMSYHISLIWPRKKMHSALCHSSTWPTWQLYLAARSLISHQEPHHILHGLTLPSTQGTRYTEYRSYRCFQVFMMVL